MHLHLTDTISLTAIPDIEIPVDFETYQMKSVAQEFPGARKAVEDGAIPGYAVISVYVGDGLALIVPQYATETLTMTAVPWGSEAMDKLQGWAMQGILAEGVSRVLASFGEQYRNENGREPLPFDDEPEGQPAPVPVGL